MLAITHTSLQACLTTTQLVSVLATLILFSYAKILQTLISVVSFTNLEYPYNYYIRRVWLYDANVDYIIRKHISLFLVTLLGFFLFLLYIVLLLFGQWLQALSHLRFFSRVNSARLKPFMDSYTMLPTNQNIATGLDYWLYFALFFFLCSPSIFSMTPLLTC